MGSAHPRRAYPALGESPKRREVTPIDDVLPLPTIAGSGVRLRELQTSDAPTLAAVLANEAVARFVHQPPASETAWARFIRWAGEQHRSGILCCWGIVPVDGDDVVGVTQVRRLDPDWHTAEWGILLAQAYWGTGVCVDASRCALDFAFTTLKVHRIEARVVRMNVRAQRILEKLGAVPEATLREAFKCNGTSHDQVLWSILASDWCTATSAGARPRSVDAAASHSIPFR
jgi:ribosomal-protein-alanine N-acetyltransferase